MRKFLATTFLLMLACSSTMQAASKRHVVSFGKATAVRLFVSNDETTPVTIKVRPLYVDGRLREFTTGEAHDITEQQFAVQRAYRINDSLPHEDGTLPKWRWQRGGWLLVDRSLGRVSPLRLPDFDASYSEVAWYRDYAAYCGTSDSGDKLHAMVVQIGQRRPILRSVIGPLSGAEQDSPCESPLWQRGPVRVVFNLKDGRKLTFAIRGRAADPASPEIPPPGEDESN